jgi:LPXTG-motif cell wall-anchored protein
MADWQSWILLIGAALILLYFLGFRRRRVNKLEIAIGLLADLKENIKTLEARKKDFQSKKTFITRGWVQNNDHLDFLNEEGVAALKDAFTLAITFNEKINTAKKSNNMASVQDLQFDELKELFVKSHENVAQWVRDNIHEETRRNARRDFLGF